MHHRTIALLLLGLGACRGPERYSAPAPRGALDCAVREAGEMGYRRLEGTVETGVVRLGKRVAPTPARRDPIPEQALGDAVLTDWEDVPVERQLRIYERRGHLRIEILSDREPESALERTDDAGGDAQMILAECTTPQPAG